MEMEKYTNNVSLFEGIHIFKSNPIVIEKLREQKKLLSNGELIHSYPHSWRSKAPLVHRATPNGSFPWKVTNLEVKH